MARKPTNSRMIVDCLAAMTARQFPVVETKIDGVRDDLQKFATKVDVKRFATKDDMTASEVRILQAVAKAAGGEILSLETV